MPSVLIVEDDEAMAVALRDGFDYEGFGVDVAGDGETGLRWARRKRPDLIVLDVMLPRLSGLDVLKRIRRDGSSVPVIMLSARGQEIDKVLGLKSGADDYVTKPFSFMELMARAEALLRRTRGHAATAGAYCFGGVELDFTTHEATRDGARLELTPREFRLLEYFVEHRGEVVPRRQLLDAVLDHDSASHTRTVDMHIAKLRKKIEARPTEPKFIVTVHKVGYKFLG